jgi:tRNA threonylcarbamoyladenosine modification (KEOPS) complex  Pcc1 subunit
MNSGSITENINAKISINFSPKISEVIFEALKPELDSNLTDRSTVSLIKTSKGISIILTASDITALRAALNSYLRWIKGILNMIEDL